MMAWITMLTAFFLCTACQFLYPVSAQSAEVEKLHITSDISFRFATTNVTSELLNPADTAREVTFKVTLPPAAFISSYYMIINGTRYDGIVKEKGAAKRQYEKAKKKGQSAGHVAAVAADKPDIFKVDVNIAAQERVRFTLIYDELLRRRLGLYEHVININPGQPVRDLKVKVTIIESRDITILTVPEIRPENDNVVFPEENPLAVITRVQPNEAIISYEPSFAQQREYTTDGISGEFVVQYDIERTLDGGEIQVVDGYFVHYFAPGGLQPVDKNIIFVLDVSGSMQGNKIAQTKQAMNTILDDLRAGDAFNVLTFSDHVGHWNGEMVRASEESIGRAKEFVAGLNANGGTNINAALLAAVEHLRRQAGSDVEPRPALIIFLTDGQATSGVSDTSQITVNMKKANTEGYSLFTLGFGDDVDFPFLTKIALQNDGIARKIYVDSDVSLQLQTFYEEVSTPVMSDVKIRYLDNSVDIDSVTTTDFNNLFDGTEIVVAGKLADDSVNNIISQVSGHSFSGYMEMNLRANVARAENKLRNLDLAHLTERLWAYLTIKKLLETRLETTDSLVRENAKTKALELSLKYSFVTPLTSMVVTKPDIESEPEPVLSEEPEEEPADLPPQTDRQGFKDQSHLSMVLPQRPYYDTSNTQRYRYSKRQRAPSGRSFVDNDPHFVVDVDGITKSLCFDVNGDPGNVFQLLYDKQNDLIVNAEVLSPAVINKDAKHTPTFISKIAIIHLSVTIILQPKTAVVQGKPLQWRPANNVTVDGVDISFPTNRRLVVQIGKGIKLVVLRHLTRIPSPKKIDYLGFYVETGDGLSDFCHGLLGQFQKMKAKFTDDEPSVPNTKDKVIRTIEFSSSFTSKKRVTAYLGKRRNMRIKQHIPCWYVRNNGRGLLDGHSRDYIVPSFTYRYYSLDKAADQS